MSVVPNTPLAAQEHHHVQRSTNPPGFEQYLKLYGLDQVTPIERRFSYWGYRHDELHDKGLVAKLRKATNSQCCNGEKSGECRVSKVDLPSKRVLIDDEWCPFFRSTPIAILDELESLRDGTESVAIVCAGRTVLLGDKLSPGKKSCAGVYCIGVPPVKM